MSFETWVKNFRNFGDEYVAALISQQDLATYKLFCAQYAASGRWNAGAEELTAAWYAKNPEQRPATVADIKRLLGK